LQRVAVKFGESLRFGDFLFSLGTQIKSTFGRSSVPTRSIVANAVSESISKNRSRTWTTNSVGVKSSFNRKTQRSGSAARSRRR
jgi:hypothetical protein